MKKVFSVLAVIFLCLSMTGAYIRLRLKNGVYHSVAVISTSDSEIEVYQANMDNKNTITINTYKWDDFVNTFRYLLFFVD